MVTIRQKLIFGHIFFQLSILDQVRDPGLPPIHNFFETFLRGKVFKFTELFLRTREICDISRKKVTRNVPRGGPWDPPLDLEGLTCFT